MCGEIEKFRVQVAVAEEQSFCPNLSQCVIWRSFKGKSKLFWQKRYCHGYKQHECVRMRLQSIGQKVPVNLLPNGNYLE